jgi:hypothetical protein
MRLSGFMRSKGGGAFSLDVCDNAQLSASPHPMFAVLVVTWYGLEDVAPAPPSVEDLPSIRAFLAASARLPCWNVVGVGIAQLRASPHAAAVSHFEFRTHAASEVLDAWCASMDAVCAEAPTATPVCLWWDHAAVHAHTFAAMRAARPDVRHGVFNWDATRAPFALPPARAHWYDFACVPEDVPREQQVYTCAVVRAVYPPADSRRFANWRRVLAAAEPLLEPDFDVSFALTNVYAGKATGTVPRAAAVRALAAAFGARFGLFGPPHIGALAPVAARGALPYVLLPWLAAASRVCLCLSAVQTVRRYMNERLVLLLWCGANILCDRVAGFDDADWLGADGDVVTYVRDRADAAALVAQVREMLAEAPEVTEARRARARAFAQRVFGDDAWGRGIIGAAAEATAAATTERADAQV